MFKRTLFLGMLMLLIFSATTAQDEPQNWLLISHQKAETLETIVSRLDVNSGVMEDIFSVETTYTRFRLSPTGDQVAYFAITPAERYEGQYGSEVTFYLQDVYGGAARAVASNGFMIGNSTMATAIVPAWSPDGNRVAVVNYDENETAIQFTIIDALTDEVVQTIPASPLPNSAPVWSPDGQTLAYFAEYCMRCGIGTVYVVSAVEADTPRPVLAERDEHKNIDGLMGWLPDTREVLIVRDADNLAVDDEKTWMRVNVDTGEMITVLSDNQDRGFCRKLVLLDNSRAVILYEDAARFPAMFIDIATEGERFPQLIGINRMSTFCPMVFSPDQTRVAVAGWLSHRDYGVRVYDVATDDLVTQTTPPVYVQGMVWTPDGEQVVFQVTDAMGGIAETQMFMLNVDDGTTSEITTEVSINVLGGGDALLGWVQPAP